MERLLGPAGEPHTEPLQFLGIRPLVHGGDIFKMESPIFPGGLPVERFGQYDWSSGHSLGFDDRLRILPTTPDVA